MEKTKIGIVGGLGHIGLVQAACLAKLGYQTVAYDKNLTKVEKIFQGILPFFEAGLEEIVQSTIKNGLLHFTSSVRDLQESDIIFICVGTPSLPTGEADTSQVYAAVEEVARNRNNHCLVAVKSTVPVGTNRKLTVYLEENNLSEKVAMISNPEFLREGSGVQDFWEPSRIIVGARSQEAAEKVARLYSPPGVPVIMTSWENAELIKHASNAFLANKISFINEIALLCEKVGGDIRVVSKGIGLDPRINPYFLEAGAGFSGPCLEKDLKSLIYQFHTAEKKAKLLESVLEVNEGQRSNIVHKLQEHLGTLEGRRIGVLGMAFKAETDDIRDSHSLPIVRHLLSLGAVLTVHDPGVKSPQQAGLAAADLPKVEWALSPYEAAQGKDALLILTAWPEYRELNLKRLKDSLVYPLIVDGRNLFDSQEMQALNIKYLGVGI
ncbi:MAG: UDP-glucose dehydrogenase family protein [Dethiobacteria bacterium]|jgi:UDPglucose 6-dehydrogenase